MFKKGILLIFICLLTACNNGFTLVKNEQVEIDGISIMPAGQWNQTPTYYGYRGIPTWTADGAYLNSIMFFGDIEDGKTLVKVPDEAQFPVYEAGMLPNEILEITRSTIAKMYGTTISDDGTLAPFKTKAGMGFQFSFEFADKEGLAHKLLATAILKDKQLDLVIYQAAKMYYYERDLPDVQRMMQSIDLI